MDYKIENEKLFALYQTDSSVEEKIYQLNKKIIYYVLNTHNISSSMHDFEDLFMECSIGLIKAIRSYSLSRGCTFSSFAIVCINNELNMYFRKNTKYKRFETSEFSEDGKSLLELIKSDFLLEDDYIENEEINLNKIRVDAMFRILNKKEVYLISMYYGLNSNPIHKLDEIARLINCTKSNCSRLIKKILIKLKEYDEFGKEPHNKVEKSFCFLDFFPSYSYEEVLRLIQEEEDEIQIYLKSKFTLVFYSENLNYGGVFLDKGLIKVIAKISNDLMLKYGVRDQNLNTDIAKTALDILERLKPRVKSCNIKNKIKRQGKVIIKTIYSQFSEYSKALIDQAVLISNILYPGLVLKFYGEDLDVSFLYNKEKLNSIAVQKASFNKKFKLILISLNKNNSNLSFQSNDLCLLEESNIEYLNTTDEYNFCFKQVFDSVFNKEKTSTNVADYDFLVGLAIKYLDNDERKVILLMSQCLLSIRCVGEILLVDEEYIISTIKKAFIIMKKNSEAQCDEIQRYKKIRTINC